MSIYPSADQFKTLLAGPKDRAMCGPAGLEPAAESDT